MRPLSVLLLLFALPAQALTLLTEDFPPLSYSPDGGETVVGISVDLMREALARTETPATIALMPWRNAYKRALDDADTCVFSASRTPEREPLFKWIGPLSDGKWVLFARADSRIPPVHTLEELKPYVIGGYQGDARTLYLKTKGLTVDEAHTEQQSLKKLAAGRVDLWSATSVSGPWNARQLGIKIRQVFVFRENQDSYAACNRATPDETVKRLNAALRKMHADGTRQQIMDAYYGQ